MSDWFPIMGSGVGAGRWWIPWSLIAPHEAQAQRNHSQSLARLAERGGLSPCEALAVLEDREWHSIPNYNVASLELCKLVFAPPSATAPATPNECRHGFDKRTHPDCVPTLPLDPEAEKRIEKLLAEKHREERITKILTNCADWHAPETRHQAFRDLKCCIPCREMCEEAADE